MKPLFFKRARVLDPLSGRDKTSDLLVHNGKITAIGDIDSVPPEAEVIDCAGLCLAPGLVDMRAQFGEPGAEHKERLESGVAAAAAGGVTSVALLPNTHPPIDDPAMLEFVARRARQLKSAKVYPYATITKGLEGKQLCEFGMLRRAGAVAFSDGEQAIKDAQVMRRALAYAKAFDALIVQHPEEASLAKGGLMNEGPIAARLGLAGIPGCAEVITVQRDLELVALTGGRYHVAHISTAGAIEAVRQAKADGLPVTCETAPHYFALNELEVEGYRTYAKVSPPLRGEADRQAVVEGLRDGTIDVIASDHCPQDQDSKRVPFAQAAFGVVGVETMLPVSIRLVQDGVLSLLQLIEKMSLAPARLLGLKAGTLSVGQAADLLLFDPDVPWKITESGLHSLAKNTAFEGRLVTGKVMATFVDGRRVYQ